MSASLLIVEDHHALAVAIAAGAERCGLKTSFAPSLARARELLRSQEFTGILLDIGLPDGHGLELVEGWDFPHKPEIAVITAHGEIENAIAARKLGIARFFDKPVDFEELQTFFESLSVHKETSAPARSETSRSSQFVGASQAMRPVFRQISHACASDQPVVIRGATGTGKSHVARIIRQSSSGHRNQAAIHASARLDDDDLVGALQNARGGSLVIESIHSLASAQQKLLVQALDQMGGDAPRLIVTTDEEGLLKPVTDGRFHQELYYRLQILQVSLPPLTDRLEDLPAICACFLGELDPTTGTRFDEAVFDAFASHDWPGNLRELRNAVSYALVTSAGASLITSQFIPEHLSGQPPQLRKEAALSHALEHWIDRRLEEEHDYKQLSTELESLLLEILLRRFDGKPSHLAAALSINRSTLRKKLRNSTPPSC